MRRFPQLPPYPRCTWLLLGASGHPARTQSQVRGREETRRGRGTPKKKKKGKKSDDLFLVSLVRLRGSAGRLASRLSAAPHHLQQSMTLAFLENQLAAALTLKSAPEYRYWLLIYARFLVNEGKETFSFGRERRSPT